MGKKKLVIEWGERAVRLLAVNGLVVEGTEKVSWQDLAENALVSRIRNLKGRKKSETILLLPGSLVIERRFEFEPNGHGARQAFLEKIRQILPVSLDEVSYGVRIQKNGHGFSGTLLATPLRSLNEILNILGEAGLCPDEIFSSDYPPDKKTAISLLPQEKKLEKQRRARQGLRRDCVFLLLVLCLVTGLGVKLHAYREEARGRKLQQGLVSLKPQVLEIEKMLSFRSILEKQADRNALFLHFMKALSEKTPGEVELDELRWDEKEIQLRGISLSYSGVTGVIQGLEKLDCLEPPRLESARLRKRGSRDFFEFEISAGFKTIEDETKRVESKVSRARQLLESKSRRHEEYEKLKKSYRSLLETPDLLNQWIKELMTALDAHGLKVGRLEPQGAREIDGYKFLEVHVECDGALKKVMAFVYDLAATPCGVTLDEIQILKEKYQIRFSRIYPAVLL